MVGSAYGYSTDGRFASVSGLANLAPLAVNYSYLPGSHLIAGWSSSSGLAVTRSYEPNRDLLTAVSNRYNGATVSAFDYVNDAVGRRTRRMDTTAAGPQVTNDFGYNLRSELTSAAMDTNSYGYAYDPIGNRTAANKNAEAIAYVANALNQYTNIVSNGTASQPLFDADGNLTHYNGWAFTWDAENRLVTAVNGSTVVSNTYDYMSRRVAKTVGGTTHRFIYDGWAMIQETTGTQTNSYVYGLDLSGSMQGAGTIGGILCASLNGTQAFYSFDANGNVSDLTAANGTSLARYEYDPYGNTLVATGTQAAANPFRFSTKYTDDETGFLYYGYRFYDPITGRWLSRDPIGEEGGPVYCFVGNEPILRSDSDGRQLFVGPGVPPGGVNAPAIPPPSLNQSLPTPPAELSVFDKVTRYNVLRNGGWTAFGPFRLGHECVPCSGASCCAKYVWRWTAVDFHLHSDARWWDHEVSHVRDYYSGAVDATRFVQKRQGCYSKTKV